MAGLSFPRLMIYSEEGGSDIVLPQIIKLVSSQARVGKE